MNKNMFLAFSAVALWFCSSDVPSTPMPAQQPAGATPSTTTASAPNLPVPASAPEKQGSGEPQTARDLYVSTNGIDSNPGTELMPFRTLDRAAKAAKPGATVHVAPGLYIGNVHTKEAGTSSARIRYVSAIRWQARLQGQGHDAVWTNYGDHVEIEGFDITGSGRIGILNLASHTLIAGNHVHHLALSGGCTGDGGAGIDNGNYAASNGDIVGNIVHDIGRPGICNGVHGIYSSNLGGRIVNNMVYRASSFGIHLWHAANRVTIANNTVFANGSATMGGGIVLGNGDSPGGSVLNHTKVINNIVYDNPAVSIKEFCYPGQDCTGANNNFANNLVFKNGSAISLRRGRARGTISADPAFVDYRPDGSGNYRLAPGSPAFGKGALIAVRVAGKGQANSSGSINIGSDICRVPGAPGAGLAARTTPGS
ncbi:MAG: right-handed parallel beta-helix repeat-containing protein [Massilia sp.]